MKGTLNSGKIAYTAQEQRLVLLTGHIFQQIVSLPFAVTHLAQNPAVGGGDALDGTDRAVGIPIDIAGGLAVRVHILGGDLAAGNQRAQGVFIGMEPAFTVRNGDTVDISSQGDLTEVTRV